MTDRIHPLAFAGQPPTIATALQVRRKARGLTTEQLAERSLCSPNMIKNVERGVRTPSLPMLGRLARALELTPAELLQGVTDL